MNVAHWWKALSGSQERTPLPPAERLLRGFWSDRSLDGWRAVSWNAAEIARQSQLPWLQLHCPWPIPYDEMLAEARALKPMMVLHRKSDPGYGHRGWRSLCVHGLSSFQTEDCSAYGISHADAQYRYTDVARLCPVTTRFFTETFGYDSYARVRFMLLEAGGYILPHEDNPQRQLGPVNIALNNPRGCELRMRGFGAVPFRGGTLFQLDVGTTHAVWNRSGEDRFHIIVHGRARPEVWDPIYRRSFDALLAALRARAATSARRGRGEMRTPPPRS